MFTFTKFIAASALLASASIAFAHSNEHHHAADHHAPAHHGAHSSHPAAAAQQPWGVAGQADDVTRTLTLRMTDDMRFSPDHFTVRQGETVRIRVDNAGQILHEIVLGTEATLRAHAQAMLQDAQMQHGDAFMAHVQPQQQGELIWTFNRPGTFDFACLIAGHYQAGMRGRITVTP